MLLNTSRAARCSIGGSHWARLQLDKIARDRSRMAETHRGSVHGSPTLGAHHISFSPETAREFPHACRTCGTSAGADKEAAEHNHRSHASSLKCFEEQNPLPGRPSP